MSINSKCVNKKFISFNKQIILFTKCAFSVLFGFNKILKEILSLLISGYVEKCKSV